MAGGKVLGSGGVGHCVIFTSLHSDVMRVTSFVGVAAQFRSVWAAGVAGPIY